MDIRLFLSGFFTSGFFNIRLGDIRPIVQHTFLTEAGNSPTSVVDTCIVRLFIMKNGICSKRKALFMYFFQIWILHKVSIGCIPTFKLANSCFVILSFFYYYNRVRGEHTYSIYCTVCIKSITYVRLREQKNFANINNLEERGKCGSF